MMEKKINKSELKKLYERRIECFRRYNEWEAKHRERLTAGEAVRRVGELYEMLPEEAKKKDFAAKVEGIRRMHEILGLLGRSSERINSKQT